MPRRARPLPLTFGFWLVPFGMFAVALAALLLVAQLATLPIAMANASNGAVSITGALPMLGSGGLALAGAVAVVRGRVLLGRHRRYLERRAVRVERKVTPEAAGVSPGVAGTAHRRR